MSDQVKDTTQRSALNRLAALHAGQEQLQKDVEKVHSDLKAVFIISLYAAGTGLAILLLLRYGKAGLR